MPKIIDKWQANKDLLKQELDKLGIKMLPRDYVAKQNGEYNNLGRWVETQLAAFKQGTLSEERQEALKQAGLNLEETKIKYFIKTSFPEQALAYYLSKNVQELGIVNSNDMSTGKDLDIFIPDHNIAIEYDGYNFHKDRMEEDIKINDEFSSYGLDVIRIREENLPTLSNCLNISLEKPTSDYYGDVDKMIKAVLSYLNEKYDFNLDINSVDSKKDCSDIYLRYKQVKDAEFEEFKAAIKTLKAGEVTPEGATKKMVYLSKSYKDALGFPLGKMCDKYREYKERDILPQKQLDELDKIGFIWNPYKHIIADIEKDFIEQNKLNPNYRLTPDIYSMEGSLSKEQKVIYKTLDKFRKEYKNGNLSFDNVNELARIGVDITKDVPIENKLLYDRNSFWKEIIKEPSKIMDIKNVEDVVKKANIKNIECVKDLYLVAVSFDHLPDIYKKDNYVQAYKNTSLKNYMKSIVKLIDENKISAKKLDELKKGFTKEEKDLFDKLTHKQSKSKTIKI